MLRQMEAYCFFQQYKSCSYPPSQNQKTMVLQGHEGISVDVVQQDCLLN